jgi:hypothetical protein
MPKMIEKQPGPQMPKSKGGKISTKHAAAAIQKMKRPPEELEEEAQQRGGYSRSNGGIGSG